MRLSQDEARFSMLPLLRTTLGLQGHRPMVGHLDGHDGVYRFGALHLLTGRLTTRLLVRHDPTARPRHRHQTGARHWRDIARAYPAAQDPRVVLVIDKASWPRGTLLTTVLQPFPHLACYRLPRDSPPRQVIARFWRVLRRRATHNRLLPMMAPLTRALRHSLCDDQTLKHRGRSLIQSPKTRTQLAAP